MLAGKKDYSAPKTPLKDRVRFKIPYYVSRFISAGCDWAYVTLGGPQLTDVRRLIEGLDSKRYPREIISLYFDPTDEPEIAEEIMKHAETNAAQIQADYHLGSIVRCLWGTVERPELTTLRSKRVAMFLDYEDTVERYCHEIGTCVRNGLLKKGDLLFVTSCAREELIDLWPGMRRHRYRARAERRVAAFLGIYPQQVTSEDILKFHDLNLIRDQVRETSFHNVALDCRPIGNLIVYEDTIRMLWLPLRVVKLGGKLGPPDPKLEFLKRD
jgi:hypothetical protein